jgi:hypothetical protein
LEAFGAILRTVDAEDAQSLVITHQRLLARGYQVTLADTSPVRGWQALLRSEPKLTPGQLLEQRRKDGATPPPQTRRRVDDPRIKFDRLFGGEEAGQ